jgi:hypothetical protein
MQTGDFYFGTFGENSSGTHSCVYFFVANVMQPDGRAALSTSQAWYKMVN